MGLVGIDKMADKFSEGDAQKKAVLKSFMTDFQAAPADATNLVVRIQMPTGSATKESVQQIKVQPAQPNQPRFDRKTLITFVNGLGKEMPSGSRMDLRFNTSSGKDVVKAYTIKGTLLEPVDLSK